ncbi:MAG: hypothetical protein V4649_06165 [Bacteroidota bacterium]
MLLLNKIAYAGHLTYFVCSDFYSFMLRIIYTASLLLLFVGVAHGQGNTFKAGWHTYQTGIIIHEYAYNCNFNDTVKLSLTDSSKVYATSDSLVTMTLCQPVKERSVYKTVNLLNAKKQILRTEEYKDDNQQMLKEWKYDDKNRKCYHLEENKRTGTVFKKTFNFTTDKKNGDFIILENAYYNGRIEFYTKTYYDKRLVKYKEVRLNDNNKDVVHIETFSYGENGRVKERTVFFPEWKVTKKFAENAGLMPAKCFKSFPAGIADKITPSTRLAYIKKVLTKNRATLSDAQCDEYEYCFTNGPGCEIVVTPTHINKGMKVVFRYKERLAMGK